MLLPHKEKIILSIFPFIPPGFKTIILEWMNIEVDFKEKY